MSFKGFIPRKAPANPFVTRKTPRQVPPKAQPAPVNNNLSRGLAIFAPSTDRKPDLKVSDLLTRVPPPSPISRVAPEDRIVDQVAPGKVAVPEKKESPNIDTKPTFPSLPLAATVASSAANVPLPPSPSPLSRVAPEDRIVDQVAPGTPSTGFPDFSGPQFRQYRDTNTDPSDHDEDEDDVDPSPPLAGSLGSAQCPIVDPVAPGTLPSPDEEGWMDFIANFEAKLSLGAPNECPKLLPDMMEWDWAVKEIKSHIDYEAVLKGWEAEQLARGEEGMLWEVDGEYALGENLLTDVRQDSGKPCQPYTLKQFAICGPVLPRLDTPFCPSQFGWPPSSYY